MSAWAIGVSTGRATSSPIPTPRASSPMSIATRRRASARRPSSAFPHRSVSPICMRRWPRSTVTRCWCSLPVDLHAASIEQALRAGKHVLTEKPFTPTLTEAAALTRLAEARRLLLSVSQNYRFYPATIAAARLVQSRRLGPLRYVKVDFRRNSQRDGHASPGVANPLLVDMAIHHFDLMRMIIGADPIALSCTAWTLPGSPFSSQPAASLTLRFPEGIVVSYRGNWLDLAPPTAWAGEWQMDFERGSAFWTARGGNRTNLTDQDRLIIQRLNGSPVAQRLGALRRPGRAGSLAAFARAVRTRRRPAAIQFGARQYPDAGDIGGRVAFDGARRRGNSIGRCAGRSANLSAARKGDLPRALWPIAAQDVQPSISRMIRAKRQRDDAAGFAGVKESGDQFKRAPRIVERDRQRTARQRWRRRIIRTDARNRIVPPSAPPSRGRSRLPFPYPWR